MATPGRTKFKQVSKALRSFPGEQNSLNNEAIRYDDWLEKQPKWIYQRGKEIEDWYSSRYSEIDLVMVSKEILEKDLRKILRGESVLDYKKISSNYPLSKNTRTLGLPKKTYNRKTSLAIKDSTNMSDQQLQESKAVIDGIMNTYFSKKEIQQFKENNVSMEIKPLPPDIAGQSEGNKIYLDPETVMRADGVTEDVVVHELVHAYNRFRENANPSIYLRKESMSNSPADVQKDIEIEEAVTEAITASKLGRSDEKGIPIPQERKALVKRYMKNKDGKDWRDIIGEGFEFEGMAITNPMFDETMMNRVNPVEYYGKAYMDFQKKLKEAGMQSQFLSAFLIKSEMQEFEGQEEISKWASSTDNSDPFPNNMKSRQRIIDAMTPEVIDRLGAEFTAEMLIGGQDGLGAGGLYELNAIPISEQLIPMDDLQKSDERGGQVYNLNDAYIVVIEQDNRGRLERDIVGVYDSPESAVRAEDVLIANMRDAQMEGRDQGAFEVYTQKLEANDVFEMYRRWPYLHKTDGRRSKDIISGPNTKVEIDAASDVVWQKKGVYGEKMIYQALNEDPNRMRVKTVDWLTDDIEDQDWRDQVYYRNLSGAKYRGSKRAYNKASAQKIARQARTNGFNARVIPTAKGHRIYLARRRK